jgi:hypothetical protein
MLGEWKKGSVQTPKQLKVRFSPGMRKMYMQFKSREEMDFVASKSLVT